MRYINCPTCGALCRHVPNQDSVRIDVITDHDKDRMFLDAAKAVDLQNSSMDEILEQIGPDFVLRWITNRLRINRYFYGMDT